MKKLFIGVIIGAILSFSASAYATDLKSLIGLKVQGEMTVEENGKALDNAIIVNGKAFAPMRSTYESAGYTVDVQGKKVLLKKEQAPSSNESSEVTKPTPNGGDKVETETPISKELIIEGLDSKISKNKLAIHSYKAYLENSTNLTEEQKQEAKTNITNLENELAELEKERLDVISSK